MKNRNNLPGGFGFVVLLACALVASMPVNAALVVVPGELETVDGGGNNSIPFGISYFCDNGIRYQQVYGDAEIPNNNLITGMAFRQGGFDSLGSPADWSFPPTQYGGVSITLSVTSTPPGAMSATLADNVGPDAHTVYTGDLTLSSAASTEMPRPFDIVIPFTEPFSYRDGHLLVDVVIEVCASPGVFFDRPDNSDPATERVYARDHTALVGVNFQGAGLVTQFELEPLPTAIPTLSHWGIGIFILLLGFSFIAARYRQPRSF